MLVCNFRQAQVLEMEGEGGGEQETQGAIRIQLSPKSQRCNVRNEQSV